MSRISFSVENYDLAATLDSGQAFRWQRCQDEWEGIVGGRWVRLRAGPGRIEAETTEPVADWQWLRHYLQLDINISDIVGAFPKDEPMQAAVRSCPGLRLLRQEPWECLASFICSSTKQIVQIRAIIALLCERFGEPVIVPDGHKPMHGFPSYHRLAQLTESDLRNCKLGFRAPFMLGTAKKLATGEIDLNRLHELSLDEARSALIEFPGVGPKIADCVLLFSYGFPDAFPVDVWIMKALRQLYFSRRSVKLPRLRRFADTHFRPHSGYAQQYLFHYMRTRL